MDFQGQKLSEQMFMALLVLTGVISFVYGYAKADFALFIKLFIAGTAITCGITVPDWPWFNRLKLQWQPSQEATPSPAKAAAAAVKKRR